MFSLGWHLGESTLKVQHKGSRFRALGFGNFGVGLIERKVADSAHD